MKKVSSILKSKSNNHIYSVLPDTSVYDALKLMMEKNISSVLVMTGAQLDGILTERDYARKVILLGKSSKDIPVSEIMTPEPITISPQDSIDHCMELMTNKHFRHLPVIDHENVVGILSIGDLVKSIIEDQKSTIHYLQEYINQ